MWHYTEKNEIERGGGRKEGRESGKEREGRKDNGR
jgi:hypothetical protein